MKADVSEVSNEVGEAASSHPARPSPRQDLLSTSLTGYRRHLPPILISLAFFLVLLSAARLHPYGTYGPETDFYQYYAPDAERLMQGEFPEDTYRGPGYALTLGLLTKLTGDYFLSGKLISAFSAALSVWLIFLLFSRLGGYAVGIGAQLLALVGTQFPSFAVTATTDVFFLMLCLAAMTVFLSPVLTARWRLALTAALTGFAYLTRYNGLFLLVTVAVGILVVNLFNVRWKARLVYGGAFLGVFLLVASPWLIANYRHQGSPFYNTNHLNIATEFYPDLAGGSVFQEGTRGLSERFRSLAEVLRHDPKRIAVKYPENLSESLSKSVKTDLVHPWAGWLALAGLLLVLLDLRKRDERSKAVALVLISGALYLLLVALTHWETRYYFYVMAIYSGLAAYALTRPFEWLQATGRLRPKALLVIPVLAFALLWYNSFAAAKVATQKFLATHPTEIPRASEYIKREGVSRPRVVARKPHLSYFTGGDWIFIPQVKSLDEFKAWLQENPVDYVAFGVRELQARRELSALKDPATAPAWLQPVWTNDNPPFVLYRPNLGE